MKKILVVRFSSIGDIVLTTPIVRCLKAKFPNTEIHYITKAKFKTLVESNPNIDKAYTIDKEIDEVIDQLKSEAYDFIVDLHRNLRTKRLKLALKTKSATFPKLNFQKFLLTTFKINKMPKIHVVDRYFEAVKPLGVKNDGLGLDYFIPKNDEVDLKDYKISKNYIAFAIGAQFGTKRLPIELLIKLILKLESTIVLLGSKDDMSIANQIPAKCKNVIDLTGQLNLNQSASILKQSKKVISHDTGLMHIASAFKKQIISIWGNTIPDLGMYPYLPQQNQIFSIHEVDDLNCRPCSKIGHKTCPRKHFNCMILQDLDSIAEDVNS